MRWAVFSLTIVPPSGASFFIVASNDWRGTNASASLTICWPSCASVVGNSSVMFVIVGRSKGLALQHRYIRFHKPSPILGPDNRSGRSPTSRVL
ncbi:hypothetical protein F5887DRAFT_1008129 [Amanita rubescens]|nr:hypothetical protein F5887DRAFT_1008129 [Amanita rubescens]